MFILLTCCALLLLLLILIVAFMQIPGADPIAGGEEAFECDDGSGSNFIRMKFDDLQVQELKDKAAKGEITYADSEIDVEGVVVDDDNIATFPPGKQISALAREKKGPWNQDERNLQAGTGDKHFILFRVTDVDGKVYPHDAATMSDDMFGTGTDNINLKSQLDACSVGKYNVIPGSANGNGKNGYDFTGIESATGVIDITIPISFNQPSRYTVKDAAVAAAKEKLGTHFGLSTTTDPCRI